MGIQFLAQSRMPPARRRRRPRTCAALTECRSAIRARAFPHAKLFIYDMKISVDYVIYSTKIPILAHGGASSRDDPEGGAGSGVLRPRLVTAGSGGPGHRPPG